MVNFLVELLVWIIRGIVVDLLWQIMAKLFVWLDTKVTGRWPKVVLGGVLGIGMFFAIPIVMGMLGL